MRLPKKRWGALIPLLVFLGLLALIPIARAATPISVEAGGANFVPRLKFIGVPTANLPTCAADTAGLQIYDSTVSSMKVCNGTSYIVSGGGGDVTLAAIGSSPNANGATISAAQVLNLEPASASFGGIVTTGAQSFAGVKTFASSPSATTYTATAGSGVDALTSSTNGSRITLGSIVMSGGASTLDITTKGFAGTTIQLAGVATGSLTACAGGTAGLVHYDSTTNQIKYCNGTSYVAVGGGAAESVVAPAGSTASITGAVADGASAVGVTLNNSVTLANATAKLLSIQNNGTEKAYFDKDGVLATTKVQPDGAVSLSLLSPVADGASAVGAVIGTTVRLTNAAAKTISFVNSLAVEKMWMNDTSLTPTASGGMSLGKSGTVWAQIWASATATSTVRAINNTTRIDLTSFSTNSYLADVTGSTSSLIAHKFGNYDTQSGTGQKVFAFYNDNMTTEVFSLSKEGKFALSTTDSSGTPGAATINKPTGKVSVAASASSVVVTNSTVTAASMVLHNLQFADATCTQVKNIIPAAGSFTITMDAACTADTKIAWHVEN